MTVEELHDKLGEFINMDSPLLIGKPTFGNVYIDVAGEFKCIQDVTLEGDEHKTLTVMITVK